MNDRNLWERRDGESARAYEARWAYLQMGPDRSLESVARKLGKSKTQMSKWSTRWRWVESARSYDADRARLSAKIDADLYAERSKRDLAKLRAREQQLPDILYESLIDARNEMIRVVGGMREAAEKGLPIDLADFDTLTKCVRRLSPYAVVALELEAKRLGQSGGPPPDRPTPIKLAVGAAKAALKAISEAQSKAREEES